MNEVQVLFLILAGVYLLQCLGWAPLESKVLRIGWRFRAKVLAHGLPMRFGQHKLFFLNPFSPLAGAIVCEWFPSVRNSDEGSSAKSNPPKSGGVIGRRTIRLSGQEKQQVHSAGKEVRSAGGVLFTAHSEAYANFLAGVLDRVRKRSPRDRDRAFEREFEKMFDTKRVALRLEEYKAHAVFLRPACVLLFVFLFLIAPLLVRFRGLQRIWPVLLAYLIWSLAWIGGSFLRAHRTLYPEQKEGRWQQVMVLALSPFSAIRANDVLLRDLFCAFHPLAVSYVLLSKEESRVQAERNLRQSLFRIDGDAATSEAAMRRSLESFLAKTGMLREELLRPPSRESENCRTYCPLCLAQFVLAEGECPDCGEVQLKRFPIGSESVPKNRP
jgi:hypothetical protein